MASQFSIKLSVSAADLIKSIKQTIDEINTGDKLRNKPLNISVSAAKLRESIRAAIDEINASDKLKSKPINITASESYLHKSLRNAIDNINASGALTNKPIKLSAKIDTKSLAQQIQAQIASTTDVWNQGKYTTVRDKLLELARASELTAQKFKELNNTDIDGIEEFKQELEDIGETDTARVVESIMHEVERLDEEADNTSNSVDDLTKSLEKLYETLDKIIGKQEKLADAFKKIRLGSSLSADEVYELVKEMPNILKYLEKTDDGYTISADNFNAISNENIDAEKDKLQKSITETKTQIALLSSLQKAALDVENTSGKDSNLVDHFIQLSDATEELRESLGIESMGQISKGLETLQESLKQDELHLDILTSAFDKSSANFYDDAKSKISEFNNELKTFDSAVKTLNEGNTLSYDEMVEIVELAPELQDFFDEMNGRYTIAADKITEWRKKSFDARNEYIQGLIEQAKAELQTAQDAKKAAEIVLNIQNKFGSVTEQLAAQIDLKAAEKKIKDILDVIEKYEALMGDIADSDDSGQKLTDELQNKIDYYKTILDAVSAVKDRYTEVLDNEIDALEESKDALKDANDERQRELDLIEARNNLENAKKRKVYVYTEGEGFKQVQDKKAVKEAEEKYRDAITDIQIAEIDKAIEEREKQKEALEQSVKDLLELEQNIQNSMAISQAMKALGLSDSSQLLNLPDDVKEGIINGLADATIQKDIEDNKENVEHIAVTLDNVLANLGSNKTMADLSPDILDDVKQVAYNNAVQGFVEAARDMADNMINNTTNVNNPTINQTNSIVINDATDPEKVGQAVGDYIKDMLTQYNNSLK